MKVNEKELQEFLEKKIKDWADQFYYDESENHITELASGYLATDLAINLVDVIKDNELELVVEATQIKKKKK